MSLNQGAWITQQDEYGRRYWYEANRFNVDGISVALESGKLVVAVGIVPLVVMLLLRSLSPVRRTVSAYLATALFSIFNTSSDILR